MTNTLKPKLASHKNSRLFSMTIAIGFIATFASWAHANTGSNLQVNKENIKSGEIIAVHNDQKFSLPLLKADYDIEVQGNVATVSVTQTFLNTSSVPVNAQYLFPLNQKSAVYGLELRVGDETIQAIIKRKENAKKIFEAANKKGKAAALLTQHRANMFTHAVANLMPGKPVAITLRYFQTIPKVDEAYELVIPMVVGPRYMGKLEPQLAAHLGLEVETFDDYDGVSSHPMNETTKISGWNIDKLPAYPAVIGYGASGTIDPKRVSFTMTLNAATPISGVFSQTHSLKREGDESKLNITFMDGKEIDNRDLVVRYELSQQHNISQGVLSHQDERGGFLSLAIEPPKTVSEDVVTARELVFVLDTSGSMRGHPMNASKTFMATTLKAMRPTDYFRILRFSNNTSQFATRSLRATPENIIRAQYFVNGLSAGGGTELNNAINVAFDAAQPANTMRIVVFLTDGYIGADRHVIKTVAERIGDARIYAFGVGNSVNRFLLEGMAREGRGRARYVGVGETHSEAAQSLAADLQAPLLTNISIDWNGLEITEQTPTKIPDLFAGGNVNVLARFKKSGSYKIFIKGFVNGRKASLPVDIDLSASGTEKAAAKSNAIPLLWAREMIFDKDRKYTIGGAEDGRLKEEITQLGLQFSLQSRFTSFVAVSQKIYNKTPKNTKSAQVPLPRVSGVSTSAYPNLNLSGSSTPEPEVMFSMFIVFMMAFMRFWKNINCLAVQWWRKVRAVLPECTKHVEKLDKQLPANLLKDAWWIKS